MNRRQLVRGMIGLPFATGLVLPSPARAASLEDDIARIAGSATGGVAVYARKMGASTPIVSMNADVQLSAASIIKLLIFVTLYQDVDIQPNLLDKMLTLRKEDVVGGSEILQNANVGDRFSIRTISAAMIEQSDNTASNMLISFFGFKRLNRTADHIGLGQTQIKRHFMDQLAIGEHIQNLTSAHDMGVLLYLIEQGSREGLFTIATPLSCRAMIDVLLKQEDRDKIARGLPPNTPLANKTGEIDGVRNDVGIIDPFGDSPYVLAVMTHDLNDWSRGNAAIRQISARVHHYVVTGT